MFPLHSFISLLVQFFIHPCIRSSHHSHLHRHLHVFEPASSQQVSSKVVVGASFCTASKPDFLQAAKSCVKCTQQEAVSTTTIEPEVNRGSHARASSSASFTSSSDSSSNRYLPSLLVMRWSQGTVTWRPCLIIDDTLQGKAALDSFC